MLFASFLSAYWQAILGRLAQAGFTNTDWLQVDRDAGPARNKFDSLRLMIVFSGRVVSRTTLRHKHPLVNEFFPHPAAVHQCQMPCNPRSGRPLQLQGSSAGSHLFSSGGDLLGYKVCVSMPVFMQPLGTPITCVVGL